MLAPPTIWPDHATPRHRPRGQRSRQGRRHTHPACYPHPPSLLHPPTHLVDVIVCAVRGRGIRPVVGPGGAGGDLAHKAPAWGEGGDCVRVCAPGGGGCMCFCVCPCRIVLLRCMFDALGTGGVVRGRGASQRGWWQDIKVHMSSSACASACCPYPPPPHACGPVPPDQCFAAGPGEAATATPGWGGPQRKHARPAKASHVNAWAPPLPPEAVLLAAGALLAARVGAHGCSPLAAAERRLLPGRPLRLRLWVWGDLAGGRGGPGAPGAGDKGCSSQFFSHPRRRSWKSASEARDWVGQGGAPGTSRL